MTHPLFNAVSHAQDVARYCSFALALEGRAEEEAAADLAHAIAQFHRLADDLGFVALTKADHVALTAFVEELRDFRPTIYRDDNIDPQERGDDLMPLGEFQSFQMDAADLIPAKAKQVAA